MIITTCFARLLARLLVALVTAAAAMSPTHAGPGAHGPNGEHLDAPATGGIANANPRVQTHTELFELVAELKATELSVFIDRYATNEPVLGAELVIESGDAKATATFRREQGDYVVTDAAVLKQLATPGQHALVFTLTAGQEADLLDGTLTVAADDAGHTHAYLSWWQWLLLALAAAVALVIVAGVVWALRARRVQAAHVALAGGTR